jgi:hypothetical protein
LVTYIYSKRPIGTASDRSCTCKGQCCRSGTSIPDPGSEFFHPGSGICIKEFKWGEAWLNLNLW